MDNKIITLPIGNVVKKCQMTVAVRLTGIPLFRMRLKIGIWLIKLAARIVGIKADVIVVDEGGAE